MIPVCLRYSYEPKQLIKPLKDWRGCILQLKKCFEHRKQLPKASSIVDELLVSPDTYPETRLLKNGISTLLQAIQFSHDVKYNKIMLNVTLLAFGICWFGMVSIFPAYSMHD